MKYASLTLFGLLFLVLASFFIYSDELNLFDNSTTWVEFEFFNPGPDEENGTTIWFPPYECAYDSQMRMTGEYLAGTEDSPYEVVLITDLSDSMDYCIKEPFINGTLGWDESYMFADLVGEGSHSQKWDLMAGDWYRFFDNSRHSFVFHQHSVASGSDAPIAGIRGMRFGNFTAEFEAKLGTAISNTRWMQFNFGRPAQNRLNHNLYTGGYTLRFRTNRIVQLYHEDRLIDSGTSPVNLLDYQRYSITAHGGGVVVAINGTTVIDWTSTEAFPPAYLSFSTNNARLDLDDIYITSLDHEYTATREFGYSSRVHGGAYLYKDISWVSKSEGTCLSYTNGYPPAVTSCAGLPFCTTECSSYSSWSWTSCWGQPLCYSNAVYTGSWIVCSRSHPDWDTCCNLGVTNAGNMALPGNCCSATDPTASYCRRTTTDDGITHNSCSAADWAQSLIYRCRTRALTSWCQSSYDPWAPGTSANSPYSANCVESYCTSTPPAPSVGATAQTQAVSVSYSGNCPGGWYTPTQDSDQGTHTRCSYPSCPGGPNIRCTQTVLKTATTCAAPGYNNQYQMCIADSTDSSIYYIWTRSFSATERQFRDCPDPRYSWEVYQYRPYNLRYRYCPSSNLYYRYCDTIQGDLTARNDFISIEFNSSMWADLYDYAYDYYEYYRYSDGRGTNDWGCTDCSRFYRKSFNLSENVAYQKPVSVISGTGCSNIGRLTNGNTRTDSSSFYVECGMGDEDILEVDLGELFNVTAVNLIMQYTNNDHRRYYVSVSISNDTDFSTSTLVVYDHTIDGPIEPTPEGPMWNIPEGFPARYVRAIAAGTTADSRNRFGELQVFTPIGAMDVRNLTFSYVHDDGMICHVNGEYIAYNPTYGGSISAYGWNGAGIADPSYLRNGTNVVACQVKNGGGDAGFNFQMNININTTVIHRAANFKFIQQKTLCGGVDSGNRGINPFDHRNDPDSNSCEYHEEVESCENHYPYNVSRPLNLTITGWTNYNSLSAFNSAFYPTIEYVANMLGGNIGTTGYSSSTATIDESIWDGDIIFVDGHSISVGNSYFVARIGQMMTEGKAVIMESDRVAHYRVNYPGQFFFSAPEPVSSYDRYAVRYQVMYANATHAGNGTIIADQWHQLSEQWRYLSDRNREPLDKAANLIDALHPVWHSSTTSYPLDQRSYCIQTMPRAGAEVCLGERDKLAIANAMKFLNMTVGRNISGVRAGLVAFGNDAETCYTTMELTNSSENLTAIVEQYNPDCGSTCISCAIEKGLEVLTPVMGNNVSDNIVLMTDGMARRLIDGTDHVPALARNESLLWACDMDFEFSAANRSVIIHTIYYGANDSQEASDAMELLMEIANCTGGVFASGSDPDELDLAYEYIIGELGTGYPRPKARFGNNGSLPWDFEWVGPPSTLMGSVLWRNRTCGDQSCVNLMTALNREILNCLETDIVDYMARGCTIRLNVSSNSSGTIVLSGLNISLINASRSPVAFPYPIDPSYTLDICPMDFGECGNGIWDHQFGEQCEIDADCGPGNTCIPPQRPGACTCRNASETGVCGNSVIEPPHEECDSQSAFDDFSCYPPGSRVNGYDVGCRHIIADPCGNGVRDSFEECDPSAPSPHNDDACPGDYRCVPPGSDSSCTCVRPTWRVTGGGILDLAAYQSSSMGDIHLLNHGVSPIFPRNQLLWTVGASSNTTLATFSMLGNYLQISLGEGTGVVNATLTVFDPSGLNDSFIIRINISEFNPIPSRQINSSVILTSTRIINSYYEDSVSGYLTEFGPYLFTMKVYRKDG